MALNINRIDAHSFVCKMIRTKGGLDIQFAKQIDNHGRMGPVADLTSTYIGLHHLCSRYIWIVCVQIERYAYRNWWKLFSATRTGSCVCVCVCTVHAAHKLLPTFVQCLKPMNGHKSLFFFSHWSGNWTLDLRMCVWKSPCSSQTHRWF